MSDCYERSLERENMQLRAALKRIIDHQAEVSGSMAWASGTIRIAKCALSQHECERECEK